MCTDFSITTTNKDTVIGRSMELGMDLKSDLIFRSVGYKYTQELDKDTLITLQNTRGITLCEDVLNIQNLHDWTGCYGYVAMNALEHPIVANGMNTEGLTTGTMVLAQSKYQSIPFKDGVAQGTNIIFYPFLTSWILSNCKTCQDVVDKLEVDTLNWEGFELNKPQSCVQKLRVVDPFNKIPAAFKFHFPVHDVNGCSIVLEYVDGLLTVSDLHPFGVLTNDPVIAWQQENVTNNFADVSPVNFQSPSNQEAFSGNNFTCTTFAQGTGFQGVPGSSTPVDRFVRAAMMNNFSYPVDTAEDACILAFHILNTVDIPKGISRETAVPVDASSNIVSDFTQWVTVSDLSNKTYQVRMYDSAEVFSVDLNKLSLQGLDEVVYPLPVNKTPTSITRNLILKHLCFENKVNKEDEAVEMVDISKITFDTSGIFGVFFPQS